MSAQHDGAPLNTSDNGLPAHNLDVKLGVYRHELRGEIPLRIKVEVREDRLDVFIDVVSTRALPQIRLFISYSADSVQFWDLYGNNAGGPLHRQGLGALAVNTALQFLRGRCDADAKLRGHVTDAQDLSREAQQARVAFWRAFNFQITDPTPEGDQYLRGTLGNLTFVTTGKALNEHPRIFDVAIMTWVPATR